MQSTDVTRFFVTDENVPPRFRPGNTPYSDSVLIAGELFSAAPDTRKVFSPILLRTESGLADRALFNVPAVDSSVAMQALQAARDCYGFGNGTWPQKSPAQRAAAVSRMIGALESQKARIALAEMWEIAKPYSSCISEIDRTIAYVEATLTEYLQQDGRCDDCERISGTTVINRRAPLGVVLVMGPYNVPVFETLCTALPALLMGNTVVIKMPRMGGGALSFLLPAFAEHFPPGAVNIIDGVPENVVTPMMTSGLVDVLVFIGSGRVTTMLRQLHPSPGRLRKVFGLEAKNPAVVLADADLDLAAEQIIRGAFAFNGQRCTGIKRLFVETSVHGALLERLQKRTDALKIGMPWEDGVQITPLADPRKPSCLAELLEDALLHGAHIINGGGQNSGSLFVPALVDGVTDKMRLAQVEQFGPVLPISAFSDEMEMVASIRQSDFGQQISLFGNDPDRLGRTIDFLMPQTSRINLNTYCHRGPDVLPFTGRKDSAESVVSITESLRTFSTCATVTSSEKQKELLDAILKQHRSRFLNPEDD